MRSKQQPLFLCILLCILLGGCAQPPLSRVPVSGYPVFHDDLDYKGLEPALKRSMEYLQGSQAAEITLGGSTRSTRELVRSLELFLSITADQPDMETLNHRIGRYFDLYQAGGVSGWNPRKEMLITGYYQPSFAGSLQPDSEYAYPLYRVPPDLVIQKDAGKSRPVIGRTAGGELVPYWTRGEIERNRLLRGSELVWLKNPVDAFMLHVQGSGLIRLPDGSVRGVHYAGRNGRPYRSIGKYMVDTGRISLESASLDTIRAYIDSHPAEREQILHHNESFIFFHWATGRGAVGSMGRELTPGRSVAADRAVFPPGALAFLITRQPDGRGLWKELKRFVTVQDTGSAIRGAGRVDLFWGTGAAAGRAAGKMKETGAFYLLVPKEGTMP